MPASLPGATAAQNVATPNQGALVIFDALSGPKGSPFDARKITGWTAGMPTYAADTAVDPTNLSPLSTGGLSTGIGFGAISAIGGAANAAKSFPDGNFNDDYTPGVTKPDDTAASDSTLMYIGGGKSTFVNGTGPNGNGYPPGWFTSQPAPYSAGFGIAAAGGGGTLPVGGREVTGARGGPLKSVTGAAAPGAVVETGFTNQNGVATVAGQSIFGVGTTAFVAPAEATAEVTEDA